MGHLLTSDSNNPGSNPAIVRGTNGDINLKDGQCSPNNLGPNNPDSKIGELVFRYRLEKNYQETMDQLQSIQSPSGS